MQWPTDEQLAAARLVAANHIRGLVRLLVELLMLGVVLAEALGDPVAVNALSRLCGL